MKKLEIAPGRGRPGLTRYKNKRRAVISFSEFSTFIQETPLQPVAFRSMIVILYYIGLRIAEICGDKKRTWKKLTLEGIRLSKDGMLPKNWKNTEEGELWYWKKRGPLPGILKEDITLEDNILTIFSAPLKHGKREGEGQLELDVEYPYVNLIIQQWERTEPGERVWEISTWKAWDFISKISGGRLYPHAFRLSRATVMARNPEMSIADMKQWFGWARGETADSYIVPIQSVIKARKALANEIPPELMGVEG